ncbi:negative regulator of Ofd1/Enhancer of translation termination 1 [Dipodascopsis uninucleata]
MSATIRNKRPQGLSKSKLRKGENSTAKKGKTENKQLEETIEFATDVDPEDELAQLYALYTTYLDSYLDSPKLLYGIVHECDRLLRSGKQLTALAHKIFSDALRRLSLFAETKKKKKHNKDKTKSSEDGSDDSPEDFLNAAIQRATDGLEEFPCSIDLLLVRCDTYIALTELRLKDSRSSKLVESCLDYIQNASKDYDQARSVLEDEHKKDPKGKSKQKQANVTAKELIPVSWDELRDILLRLSKALEITLESDLIAEQLPHIYTWIENAHKKEIERDPENDSIMRSSLGKFYMAKASPYLVVYEEQLERLSDAFDADRPPSKAKDEASKYLTAALDEFAKIDTLGALLPVVAEAKVSLGNLSSAEMQEQLYKEAIGHLREATEEGFGDYTEEIEELQNNEDEDEDEDEEREDEQKIRRKVDEEDDDPDNDIDGDFDFEGHEIDEEDEEDLRQLTAALYDDSEDDDDDSE